MDLGQRLTSFSDVTQRSNYAEPTGTTSFAADDDEEAVGGRTTKGRARQTISDKRAAEHGRKKKSTMGIRTAVLYKKNFALLLEESVSRRCYADGKCH